MTLGEQIRQARKAAGLTLRALAELIGADAASISRWETGKVSPTWATVERIALGLGLPLKELVTTTWENPDTGELETVGGKQAWRIARHLEAYETERQRLVAESHRYRGDESAPHRFGVLLAGEQGIRTGFRFRLEQWPAGEASYREYVVALALRFLGVVDGSTRLSKRAKVDLADEILGGAAAHLAYESTFGSPPPTVMVQRIASRHRDWDDETHLQQLGQILLYLDEGEENLEAIASHIVDTRTTPSEVTGTPSPADGPPQPVDLGPDVRESPRHDPELLRMWRELAAVRDRIPAGEVDRLIGVIHAMFPDTAETDVDGAG